MQMYVTIIYIFDKNATLIGSSYVYPSVCLFVLPKTNLFLTISLRIDIEIQFSITGNLYFDVLTFLLPAQGIFHFLTAIFEIFMPYIFIEMCVRTKD